MKKIMLLPGIPFVINIGLVFYFLYRYLFTGVGLEDSRIAILVVITFILFLISIPAFLEITDN